MFFGCCYVGLFIVVVFFVFFFLLLFVVVCGGGGGVCVCVWLGSFFEFWGFLGCFLV